MGRSCYKHQTLWNVQPRSSSRSQRWRRTTSRRGSRSTMLRFGEVRCPAWHSYMLLTTRCLFQRSTSKQSTHSTPPTRSMPTHQNCTSAWSTSSDDVRPLPKRSVCSLLTSLVSAGSSLEEKPSDAVATAASAAIAKLLPGEVSLEVFNSQYLQQHSSRADAILAAAKVSRTLGAPREEVEASAFNALNADVEIKLEVRSLTSPYLTLPPEVLTWPIAPRLPSQPSPSSTKFNLQGQTSSERRAKESSSCRRCSYLQTNSLPRARPSCRRIPSRRRSRRRWRSSANRTTPCIHYV